MAKRRFGNFPTSLYARMYFEIIINLFDVFVDCALKLIETKCTFILAVWCPGIKKNQND